MCGHNLGLEGQAAAEALEGDIAEVDLAALVAGTVWDTTTGVDLQQQRAPIRTVVRRRKVGELTSKAVIITSSSSNNSKGPGEPLLSKPVERVSEIILQSGRLTMLSKPSSSSNSHRVQDSKAKRMPQARAKRTIPRSGKNITVNKRQCSSSSSSSNLVLHSKASMHTCAHSSGVSALVHAHLLSLVSNLTFHLPTSCSADAHGRLLSTSRSTLKQHPLRYRKLAGVGVVVQPMRREANGLTTLLQADA